MSKSDGAVFIKVHRGCKKFQNGEKPFLFQEELAFIMGDSLGTGKFAIAVDSLLDSMTSDVDDNDDDVMENDSEMLQTTEATITTTSSSPSSTTKPTTNSSSSSSSSSGSTKPTPSSKELKLKMRMKKKLGSKGDRHLIRKTNPEKGRGTPIPHQQQQ